MHAPATTGPPPHRAVAPAWREAAAYLGVSFWSVRDWCLAGYLPTVELPALRPREGERPKDTLRRKLIDRADLDAFIEHQREL
jgi:hypothetical protein